MMVVLGVVVFFTMLGFMGLEMATKDSQVSGTLLDIKSKESAAWGGLNLALGAMQGNPSNLATQMQKFIADSALASGSKRQWFSFSGGTFTLVAADPGFFDIGSGGDKSGIKVRIVSMNINGASGITDGSGIPITLECTGQGRNGQQLKLLATYRMLGVDIPTVTTIVNSPLPINALYLNGNLPGLNCGGIFDGNFYSAGSFTGNANGILRIKGKLRILGDVSVASGGGITVDSNSYIGGAMNVNSGNPMWFKSSLGVGTGLATINDSLRVDGNLNLYGTSASHNWGAPSTYRTILRVGGQLFVRDQYLNPQAAILVGGPAYFYNSFQTTAGTGVWARDSFYSRLQVSGSTNTNNIQGAVYADTALFIGTKTVTVSSNTMDVAGPFQVSNNLADLSLANSGRLNVGGLTMLANGVTGWGTGIIGLQTKGKLYLKAAASQTNAGAKLDAWDTVTINNTLAGGAFGAFNLSAPATNRVFRTQNSLPAASMTNQTSGLNNANVAYAFPASVPTTTPKGLTQLGYAIADTVVTLPNNPPDTIRLSGSGTTDWTGKVVNLSSVAALVSPAIVTTALKASDMTNLYNYLKAQNKLTSGASGYMIVRLDVGSVAAPSMQILSTDVSKFSGKAVYIIDAPIKVNSRWPVSNSSSDYQVIYMPNGSGNCSVCTGTGALLEFGTIGPVYGYVSIEKTTPAVGSWGATAGTINMKWGTAGTTADWYGAMSFGFQSNSLQGNSAGNLAIHLNDPATQSMFNDLATIGIIHTTSASGSGSGTSTKSTKTLTVRAPSAGIQFVRVGEFR